MMESQRCAKLVKLIKHPYGKQGDLDSVYSIATLEPLSSAK